MFYVFGITLSTVLDRSMIVSNMLYINIYRERDVKKKKSYTVHVLIKCLCNNVTMWGGICDICTKYAFALEGALAHPLLYVV